MTITQRTFSAINDRNVISCIISYISLHLEFPSESEEIPREEILVVAVPMKHSLYFLLNYILLLLLHQVAIPLYMIIYCTFLSKGHLHKLLLRLSAGNPSLYGRTWKQTHPNFVEYTILKILQVQALVPHLKQRQRDSCALESETHLCGQSSIHTHHCPLHHALHHQCCNEQSHFSARESVGWRKLEL